MADHIHDCTGPDGRCHCGWKLDVPPICVSVEIHNRHELVTEEGFNCNNYDVAIDALERVIGKLRAAR